MPQNISGAPIAQPSVQVDSYADRLMDDLFEDVEGLLSGSVPPPEPVRAQTPQKKPEFVMPPAISAIVAAPALSLPNLPQWNMAASMPEMEELITAERIQPHNHRFQKFLAIAFGLTAMAAASLWLIQRGTVQRMFAVMTQEPSAIATSTPIKPQAKDANAQFAKYMQRSLETLDRKVATKPTNVTPFKSGLPPVPVASNAATPKSSSPVVITVPSIPSSTPTTVNNRTPQELNQVLTRLSSVLERLSINPPSNPISVRPNVPSAPVIIPSPTIAPSPAAEAQRALRGIAIATDPTQSAILFEMNGVTQRYYIGESIGSSGWSVVDIANNYVTIRKNGEIRSLSIGQKL